MDRLKTLCRTLAAAVAVSAAAGWAFVAQAQSASANPDAVHLRIVGGLAGVNQYTRHEEPFWTRELARSSAGRASAEIVPFDRAGIRGQEMLRLVQLGVVPFGTALLAMVAVNDAELALPDLAGLNPDMPTLRRNVSAFRPHLQKLLRERYGAELLALYAYPAQVTFCTKPIAGLHDLAGRRIRVVSGAMSDWVTSLGATPVPVPFAEVVANVKSGNIDCVITGTMSGNTIGLHEVTSHLYTAPVNWGVAAFVANGAAWSALPPDVQALLRKELPTLEQAIWLEAANETSQGIACNVGAAECSSGRKGRMKLVPPSATDLSREREMLVSQVLPSWLKRCGPQCAQVWAQTVGPGSGIKFP